MNGEHLSVTSQHFTPPLWIDLIREVLGEITTDPASCAEANKLVRALTFYDEESDGLSVEWKGKVFCNPPGDKSGKLVQKFFSKMEEQILKGNVTEFIWLAFNISQLRTLQNTGSLLNHCSIFIPSKRIRFTGDSPTKDNAFLYWGEQADKFCKVFSKAPGMSWRKEWL